MHDVATRRAPTAPTTLNEKARTVAVVAATAAAVQRSGYRPDGTFGPWLEVLDIAGADTTRAAGAPVLTDHVATTDKQAGVVDRVWVERGVLMAEVRFATSTLGDEVFTNVRDGIFRGVSIGYGVKEWKRDGKGKEDNPTFRAVRWTFLEVSFVPIPADPAATVRGAQELFTRALPIEGPSMTDITTAPAEDAGTLAVRAERQRMTEIEGVLTVAARMLPGAAIADMRTRATTEGLSVEAVRALAFQHAANEAKGGAGNPQIRPTQSVQFGPSGDDPAVIRERMAEALVARHRGIAPSEPAREFRNMSIVDLAAELLERRGERVGRNMPASQIIARSLTTSDFPMLLVQATNRTLRDRLQAAPGAARIVTAQKQVPDFRTGWFLEFAGPATLERLSEGGPITRSPPAERGESYAVQTFARQLQMSRQMMVNDDLGALDRAQMFANAIIATEAAQFVTMFATNGGGWGPTLNDTVPLFHSTHQNVSGGAVGTSGISAARIVMRGQKDANANLVAPEPRFILVGPDGETAAEQAISDLSTATGETSRPIFSGRLQLAVEPRLAGVPWYLFGDPSVAPMIAFVTLTGTGGMPMITDHTTSDFDGLSLKIVHDFAIAPMSFVGGVRVTGS